LHSDFCGAQKEQFGRIARHPRPVPSGHRRPHKSGVCASLIAALRVGNRRNKARMSMKTKGDVAREGRKGDAA
jgi:hypothetical protein